MDNQFSLKLWKKFFIERGVRDDLQSIYLKYIKVLAQTKSPVIFELEHLSTIIGVEYFQLCKMIAKPDSFYRQFSIKKRNGDERELSSPYPSLLKCQDWIYNNILSQQVVHSCAQGFVQSRSIITNATPHLDAKALLKMDLKDFFPSIPINWVISYFKKLGYADNVSYYLARLCCYNDHLPQGASTSPCLSNLLLFSFDNRLQKLSEKFGLNYTRYADDLTFSGDYISFKFANIVSKVVSDYGLSVNESKTRLSTKQGKRIVTGISVSGAELKLPRDKKREIRKEIYFIKNFGLMSHVSKVKVSKPNYLESLEGRLVFWLQVEPNNDFAKESLNFVRSLTR